MPLMSKYSCQHDVSIRQNKFHNCNNTRHLFTHWFIIIPFAQSHPLLGHALLSDLSQNMASSRWADCKSQASEIPSCDPVLIVPRNPRHATPVSHLEHELKYCHGSGSWQSTHPEQAWMRYTDDMLSHPRNMFLIQRLDVTKVESEGDSRFSPVAMLSR
jgi:hypothetical protein